MRSNVLIIKKSILFCCLSGLVLMFILSCGKDDGNDDTLLFPVVVTSDQTVVTDTIIQTGGEVISDGGEPVIMRGICWSTASNPTLECSFTEDGMGMGEFTTVIKGLERNTRYYIRAYASNSNGTGYGNELGVKTPPAPLQIGQQYQGGRIAHIFEPGEWGYVEGETHGLIAAPSTYDASWGCSGLEINGASGWDMGDGLQNTLDIIAGCQESGIAAALAYGTGDWFLPSFMELGYLWVNRSAIGFSGIHWSSSQCDAVNAAALCSSGGLLQMNKNLPCKVRPIKYF